MNRFLAALCLAFALMGPGRAGAASPTCRVSATPWLGCPAALFTLPGTPCACPSSDGTATGQVAGDNGAFSFDLSSESTKMALGVSNLLGPVTAFVPRDLPAHRGEALSPAQQQMLQIYDFFQFRNFAGGGAAGGPVGGGAGGAAGGSSSSRPYGAAPPPPAAIPPSRDDIISGLSAGPSPPHPRGIQPIGPLLTPARIFLRAQDIPPAGIGAYGVLALTERPTPASAARLTMVCRAFLASLPRQDSLPAWVTPAEQMLTIWPIDMPPPRGADSDCDYLLAHADLYSAYAAIRDARSQGNTLQGRGPYLIGWSPSSSRAVPDAVVLVIDMSDFDTQDSFDRAFLFWRNKIVQDPSLWRSGFALGGIRLAIRDFADHYGTEFLHAFKIGGD